MTLLYRCVIFTLCVKVLMPKPTVQKIVLMCEITARKERPWCVKSQRLALCGGEHIRAIGELPYVTVTETVI